MSGKRLLTKAEKDREEELTRIRADIEARSARSKYLGEDDFDRLKRDMALLIVRLDPKRQNRYERQLSPLEQAQNERLVHEYTTQLYKMADEREANMRRIDEEGALRAEEQRRLDAQRAEDDENAALSAEFEDMPAPSYTAPPRQRDEVEVLNLISKNDWLENELGAGSNIVPSRIVNGGTKRRKKRRFTLRRKRTRKPLKKGRRSRR